MKKNVDITKPLYSEQILPVPWAFVISRFYCTLLKINKTFTENEVDVNCGNANLNEDMIVALVIAFLALQINSRKVFRNFNGIGTHGLCVSDAVLSWPTESNYQFLA